MIKIIKWVIKGMFEEYRERIQSEQIPFDLVIYIAEWDEYEIMLRKLFYK